MLRHSEVQVYENIEKDDSDNGNSPLTRFEKLS